MTGDSDERLAALLNIDAQQGYVELTNKYLGFVYKIAYSKLFGTCSKEDIEEFVCDIFYEFYCNRDKINLEKGSIKYLFGDKNKPHIDSRRCRSGYDRDFSVY